LESSCNGKDTDFTAFLPTPEPDKKNPAGAGLSVAHAVGNTALETG